MRSSGLIDIVIPVIEVPVWKLLSKHYPNRVLGFIKRLHEIGVHETLRDDCTLLHVEQTPQLVFLGRVQ